MVKVLPFSAWRYNEEKIDINEVVAPPYDVVSASEIAFYKNKSPYNIFHLELPDDNNKAKKFLTSWIENKILIKEKNPSFYYYEIDFVYNKKTYKRRGIVTALELVPFEEKKVLPHEKVYFKVTKERFELLKTVGFQFSQIFGLFEDKNLTLLDTIKENINSKLLLYKIFFNNEIHTLYKIPDSLSKFIEDFFLDKKIYIADGHHRYTTFLFYKEYLENKEETKNPLKDYNYISIYLTPFEEKSLLMLPTHRIYKGFFLEDFLSIFKDFCEIKEIALETIFSQNIFLCPEREWVFVTEGKALHVNLKKEIWDSIHQEEPELSQITLYNFLKLFEEKSNLKEEKLKEEGKVCFLNGVEKVIENAKGNRVGVVFPMLSPFVIKKISLSGKTMPHKSTYFYPKILTGVLLKQANGSLITE